VANPHFLDIAYLLRANPSPAMRMVFSILLLFSVTASAQIQKKETRKIDSFRHLLATTHPDTPYVLLLVELSYNYEPSNPDTALKLANEALNLSKKT
jgi:hypothetical protein